MTERYKISVGEVRTKPSGIPARSIGDFAVSFSVDPPIRFNSPEAVTELGAQTLAAINVMGENYFLKTKPEERQGEHALVSFSHGSADGKVTIGNISGYTEYVPSRQTIKGALDLVLNGE